MNIPIATYRIQFHCGYTFSSCLEVLPYLKELGVSHIYASPILKATGGSQHGYDIVDPTQINPELGGIEKFNQLIEKLKTFNLAWIQDIVPNHMAYNSQNLYLMDVLEKGIRSKYRRYFDVDWDHPYENLHGCILAPFLGEFYGTCLDNAEIRLKFGNEGFSFCYGDFSFPLRIEDYSWVMKLELSALEQKTGRQSEAFTKFCAMAQEFENLCGLQDLSDYDTRVSRLKSSLNALCQSSEAVRVYLDAVLQHLNGIKAQPSSFDTLDALLRRQNFRFSFWKVGNEEINYRRFFTVNGLLSLKIEEKDVFDFAHALIFNLVHEGKISGLRIDHLDGLYNPLDYLHKLKEAFPDIYVVAEKILDLFEELPSDMALQGTTGYDFLNFNNGIFVEKNNKKRLNSVYMRFTGIDMSYKELVIQKKRLFMGTRMAGEVDNLAHILKKILGASRYGRDITIYGLKRGIVEIFAHLPIYRTYVSEGSLVKREENYIRKTFVQARNSQSGLVNELNLIERILFLHYSAETSEAEKREWAHFTKRFQQLSGALMAKGAEDTTFYIYNRLLSLNEVGGDPSSFGVSMKEFHEFHIRRLRQWPHSMNATATHDTKRGEDARARLNVLSEIPKEWVGVLKTFIKLNKPLKKSFNESFAPDNNDEYLIYQALIGAYPFSQTDIPDLRERMKNYIVKAIREAKVHTAWIRPDMEYEDACVNFVDCILDTERSPEFLRVFIPFQKKIAYYGIFNSLSQLLLKLTCPGVPDIYQGSDLWDFNLVDPDNRRPVDFKKRKDYLDVIKAGEGDLSALVKELFAHKEDGRIKLFSLYRLLKARNMFKELFQKGEYIPLKVEGRYQNNIITFSRRTRNVCSVAIAPRFLSQVVREDELPLGNMLWQDTSVFLPRGFPLDWDNALTGQNVKGGKIIRIGDVLNTFPIALLIAGK